MIGGGIYFKSMMLSKRSTTLDFCYGGKWNDIVSLDDKIQGIQLKSIIAVQGIFMVIVRTLIYIFLFINVYFQNESMTGIVTKKCLQKRKQRNAVSLAGQMICFVVEIITAIIIVLIIAFGQKLSWLNVEIPSIVIAPIQAPVLSLTLILTSPELISHLKKYHTLSISSFIHWQT